MNKAFVFSFLGILLIASVVLFSTFRFVQSPTGQVFLDINEGENRIITIREDGFTPDNINANVGDQITWVNTILGPQTVTSEDFGSELLFQNDSFSVVLDKEEIIEYYSMINKSFRGRIVVEE